MVGNSGPGFPNKKAFKTGFEAWKGKSTLQYSHTGEGGWLFKGIQRKLFWKHLICACF